ncbi:MAG: glycosyltransferase family 1 protein [Muribaculaceae bacterium]|nr:glycosyltransferase family 1 protein [Muribaculaceae bacterium]
MKILFLGDASNMHNCLAGELRRQGHHCVVASNGSRWMDTARDVDLTRRPGLLGATAYLARVAWLSLTAWRGFDVVVLCGHHFLELKPAKLRLIADRLKRHNRRVILSALGTDIVYWRACHDGHTFRYSDYRLGDRPSPYVDSGEYRAQHQDNWQRTDMAAYGDHIVSIIDGAIASLYEYYAAYRPVLGSRATYGGIPVDTAALQPVPRGDEPPQKVRLFIGIQRDRTVIKGTDRLLEAARRLHDRHPEQVELDVVENLPYNDYVQRMRHSHVLLDQLYSYTPATNALIAMAQGIATVSGGEPEYYDLLGERDLRPIINVDPTVEGDLDARLEWLVSPDGRAALPRLWRESRTLVERHNSAAIVAHRWLDFLTAPCF